MKERALIIEGDLETQSLARHLLTRRGYDVSTASGLSDLACQPDLLKAELILMDLALGEFTGLDVIQFLNDLRLNAAIVLLSECDEMTTQHVLDMGRACGLRMLGHRSRATLITGLDPLIKHLHGAQKVLMPVDLDIALREGHLALAYQPKLDLRSGQVTGVEALVRWHDPLRGTLHPASFIALAEQSHQINSLTWHVLNLALAQQAQWRARQWSLDMAVNISPLLLRTPEVLVTLDRMVSHHGGDLQGLTLELTESAGIACLGYARHLLTELRERGCRLALDDFGTGYSSMTQLYRLPFDELKLDRGFVSLSDQDPEANAITLSIVELGKRLNLNVVAEGIETPAQRDLLKRAGCHQGQGYLFSRALSPAEFDPWFQAHSNQAMAAPPSGDASSARSPGTATSSACL